MVLNCCLSSPFPPATGAKERRERQGREGREGEEEEEKEEMRGVIEGEVKVSI